MFIRVKQRQLKTESQPALDIQLLKSYRAEGGKKQKFIKQWTIRKSEIWSTYDLLLDDINWDMSDYSEIERDKILTSIRQKLELYHGRPLK